MLSSVNLNYDTIKNKLFFMNNNEKVHVYLRQSGGRNYIVPINKKYKRVHVSGLPKKLLINKDAYSTILNQVKNYPVIHKKDGLYYLNNKVQSSLKKAMKKLRRYQTGGANSNPNNVSEQDETQYQNELYQKETSVIYNLYCTNNSEAEISEENIRPLVEKRAKEIYNQMNPDVPIEDNVYSDIILTIIKVKNDFDVADDGSRDNDGKENDKLKHYRLKKTKEDKEDEYNEDEDVDEGVDDEESTDYKLNSLVRKKLDQPKEDEKSEANNTVRGPTSNSSKYTVTIKGDSRVVNENIFKEKSKITIDSDIWHVLYVRKDSRLQGLLTNWDNENTKQGQIVSSYIGDNKHPERKNRFGRSVGYLKNITERLRDCTDISVAYKEKHKEVEQMIITIRKLYSLIIFLRDQITKNQENYETLEKLILEIMIAMKSDVHISEGELTRLKMIQKKIQDDGVELEKKFRIVSNQILDRLKKADALKDESPEHIGPDFPTVPDVKYNQNDERYKGEKGQKLLQDHISAVNPNSYTLRPREYNEKDEHESTRYFKTITVEDPLDPDNPDKTKNIATGQPIEKDPDPFISTSPEQDRRFQGVSQNQYGKFTRGEDYQGNEDDQWRKYNTLENSPIEKQDDVPSSDYNKYLNAPHEDWKQKRLKDLKRTKEDLTKKLHETAKEQFKKTVDTLKGKNEENIRSVAYNESDNELNRNKQPDRSKAPGNFTDAKKLTNPVEPLELTSITNPPSGNNNNSANQGGGSRNRRSKLQKLRLKKSKFRKIRKSLKKKLKKSKILLKKYKNLSRMYRHSAKKQKKYH